MEKYSIIDTPFRDIVTIKKNSDNLSFRPAATGLYSELDLLKTKADMEEYENLIINGSIASAAHFDIEAAKRNATNEFIERSSVALWWHYHTGIEASPNPITLESGFNIYQGRIDAIHGLGSVAISILENNEKYPYLALGSSFDHDRAKAGNSAYLESIQSWVGSCWLKNNSKPLYWDLLELKKRANEITLADSERIKAISSPDLLQDIIKIELSKIGNVAIAGVFFIDEGFNSDPGKFLKSMTEQEPTVFSDPNH